MVGNVRVRLLVWAGLGVFAIGGGTGMLAEQPQAQEAPAPRPVNESDDPVLKRFVWRSIGPAVMGGRVDDIAVDESNPSTFYVGYATGGIWKTVNNGTTWTPIFDDLPVSSIGDIELAPSNPNIIYVGTGEPNNRQSSSFGAGVYKSTDGGLKFEYVGLKETQSIAKVVVHPKDPNTVYVAAVGHLFGPNPERGVFKSTDGGKTWTNTKFIDNDTGFIDLVMHPTDPNTLFAASYQRRRQPWGFNGGGPGSGIWRTSDAGKTWTRLMGSGLPPTPVIGRIGLNISRSKPTTIYAQLEVGPSGGTGAGVNDDGTLVPPGGRGGGGGGGGRGGEAPPPDPTKSGVWRSDDGGKSWKFMSNNNNRPMYYSKIRVDPSNPDIVYTTGASAYKSVDGGKTFNVMGGQSHSDHHALWINPRNGQHLIIGNDGGVDISYDQGTTWEELSLAALGQFYAISVDMRKPYYVCGGLQDNGSWCGPSAVRSAAGIMNADWYRTGGGDGFYTANDPRDWTIIYTESQDGATNRYDLKTGQSKSIRPTPPFAPPPTPPETQPDAQGRGAGAATPAGAQAAGGGGGRGGRGAGPGNIVPPPPPGTYYRFYWSTPFMLSHHDPSTVYLGGDRLFKSTTRGDTWTASPDLTKNIGRNDRPIMGVAGTAPMASKHDGAASYSNIITIGESPLVAGIIWVGTNDGNVQVSRDGGATWKNVVDNIINANGRARRDARVTRRAVGVRRRHVLRVVRRPSQQRPQALRVRDPRLRADLDLDRRESAHGQRQRHQGGSEEPQPPLRRHRVRVLHLADRRQGLEAIHDRPADGPHRRRPGAPARQRSRPRHPRPQHLDHRRHHAPAADDRRDLDDRRAPLRGAQGHGVGERHYEGERTQRRQALPRPESRRAARPSATT